VRGDRRRAELQYRRALEVAERGAKDEYAAGLALGGLAHVLAERDAPESEVAAAGAEALARLDAARNLAARPHACQRIAEAWHRLGRASRGEHYEAQARDAFARLGLPVVDWWPRPGREHWRPTVDPNVAVAETTRPFAVAQTDRPATPSVSEVTRLVAEHAPTRPYPPLFRSSRRVGR
jgi:hypothetical protein